MAHSLSNIFARVGCSRAVLTTGKITKPAQILFDTADIAWAQNIPEREFMEREAQEEG